MPSQPISWTFKCYVDRSGNDAIYDWYSRQSVPLQAKLDTRIRFLRQQPREGWVRPYFDILGDDCKQFGEIRFEFKNVQYRPLGYFSAKMEFTLLMVAIEKSGKFVPPNACARCSTFKNEIEADSRRACDCSFC